MHSNARVKYMTVTDAECTKKLKLSCFATFYVGLNIHKYLRIYFTKLRQSRHKFLVERGR